MSDPLELPVAYNGEERLFPMTIVSMGYTYRIAITVNGHNLIFERDEEMQLRALVKPEEVSIVTKIDAGLMAAIMKSLQYLMD